VGGRHLADRYRGGPLWLASVRDGFSRRIVGWKASDRADVELVLGALEYAVWGRGLDGDPAQRRLIQHSDRGAQYTAIRFTQRLADAGIQPSMGSVGDSFDNALAENFFSLLKVERVYRTREEAELDIFCFIDGWYNPHRIQRELGWLSPDEYPGGVLPPRVLWQPGFTCRRQIADPPRNRGNPNEAFSTDLRGC
jgi:putative transposase